MRSSVVKGNIKFQEKLRRLAYKHIFMMISIAVLLFAIGIYLVPLVSAHKNSYENCQTLKKAFNAVYEKSSHFLQSETVTDLCLTILKNSEISANFSYPLYELNSPSEMKVNVIVSSMDRITVYNSFPLSGRNMHRDSFNRAVCGKTMLSPENAIYTTVYYAPGIIPEYVMSKQIYEYGKPTGFISIYLSGEWGVRSDLVLGGIITDTYGRIIYNSGLDTEGNRRKFIPQKTHGLIDINGKKYIIVSESSNGGVIVYGAVYYPSNYALIVVGGGLVLLLCFDLLGLTSGMSWMMAERSATAIKKLVSEINIIVDGDQSYRVSLDTNDEFSVVGKNINLMLDTIKLLNEQSFELLKLKNQAERSRLEAQLNPHFLYNALENVRNANIFDKDAADKIICNLIKILRYSINNTDEEVKLRIDIEHLNYFLEIQKIRFGERFKYEISLDNECLEQFIPKMIILTLVENSIKHGFKNRCFLEVWIDGYIRDGCLNISVTDNGAGIDKETIDEINKSLHCGTEMTVHRGLKNISRRLQLQYGGKSGLTLIRSDGGLQVLGTIQMKGKEYV